MRILVVGAGAVGGYFGGRLLGEASLSCDSEECEDIVKVFALHL